jgi:ABC-type nitrate/sulfonate/bicarbonate transport system permease component
VKRGVPWGIIVLLALWCLASLTRFVDPLYLPSPIAVLREGWTLLSSGV